MSATGLGSRKRNHKLGTVKTALNVADLNTKKLTYARSAFVLHFFSQVEYSEDGELAHTGEGDYKNPEQEERLKDHVEATK